jgi:hypothetical protein
MCKTRRGVAGLGLALLVMLALALPAAAHAPSGAIFTTLADGSEVNFNLFPSKEAVYLDGGPGPGAPQTAAGLDDGSYVFMVTDPSGKTLLSTDPAQCRQFAVIGGVIANVAPAGACAHLTGTDLDHDATTVQLLPYDDTPNNGGVYKVWVTLVADYQCALAVVDCGNRQASGSVHGFLPRHSKTDNFKVAARDGIIEIDTRFFADRDGDGHRSADEPWLDGRQVTWTDTHGATNVKTSYYAPQLLVFHEAHVEAPEVGVHQIAIAHQVGCLVGLVHLEGIDQQAGPQTVAVEILQRDRDRTVFIDVACTVP